MNVFARASLVPIIAVLIGLYPAQVAGQVPLLTQEDLTTLACQPPGQPLQPFASKRAGSSPVVRVGYIIPSNRTPQPGGVAALQKAVRMTQAYYRDQMTFNQRGPKTFQYETESDGVTPFIHVVSVGRTDEALRGSGSGDIWTNTITAASNAGLSIWASGEVWILVPEVHLQQPDGALIGGVALGASSGIAVESGVAMLGSLLLPLIQRDAILDNRPYDGLVLPELGPYPLVQDVSFAWFEGHTLSSVTSSWLGALMHELGHAFGLPHDPQNDANFHGNLMFNGLRGVRGALYPDRYPADYTRLAYGAALELDTSHFFNNGGVSNGIQAFQTSLRSSTPQGGRLVFDISATDPDGLSVLRIADGGGNIVGDMALSGTHFDGQVSTPYFEPGVTTDYSISLKDRAGNKDHRRVLVSPEAGSNSAPRPFVKITPPIGEAGQGFTLDAGQTFDPNHNTSVLEVEWDLDFDGTFDTSPSRTLSLFVNDFSAGNRFIQARLTDPSGAHALSAPIALHVGGTAAPAVTGFTLIDPQTGEPVPGFDPIPDGAVLVLDLLPAFQNIRANTTGDVESVRFSTLGHTAARTENQPPYALFGDAAGTYARAQLPPGRHTLTATPYALDGAQGPAGTPATISFTVLREDPGFLVPQFTLVDAATDTDLFVLEDGQTLDLALLPARLNVRADVAAPARSVRFSLAPQGLTRIENTAPFALFGDVDGDYAGGTFARGVHTLTATPYAQANGQGAAGPTGSITLNVAAGAAPAQQALAGGAALTGTREVPDDFTLEAAYPNPFNPATTVRFALPVGASVRLVVYDLLGREVRRLVDGVRAAGWHEVTFDAGGLPGGTYLYRLETPAGRFTNKMVLLK